MARKNSDYRITRLLFEVFRQEPTVTFSHVDAVQQIRRQRLHVSKGVIVA